MVEFDPFDVAYFSDPYPVYRQLRDEQPVYKRELTDHRVWPHYWVLSRAEDVRAGLKDWQTFSSARGTLIDTDISLLPPNIFNMDPPRHDELRAVLVSVLTPKRVADLETDVRDYARELVEEFQGRGGFDAATEFGQMIPTITMCTLMDLPSSERKTFLQWNLDTLAGADFTSDAALKAYGEMEQYWQSLVEERRAHPGADLISQILHTEVKGEPLSTAEVAGFCSLLHDAAQNTTMNMITHSVMALGRQPDAIQALAEDPNRWQQGFEELLRFISPVQGLARTATRDVELHGVTIPAGDQVLMLYGSANHDERVFPDPERLDLDRSVKNHYSFGHGIHYCLGNAVARLEVRVALQALIDLAGDWSVRESGVELNQLVPTRGVAHAPIELAARG